MIERQTKRRITAMVGATAVGLAALFGAGSAANAVDPIGPVVANIDFDHDGSLTIHKYLHQTGDNKPVGDVAGGAAADGTFTDPVGEVEFTVYPLLSNGGPIDLSSAGAWNALNGLTPGAACTPPVAPVATPPAVAPVYTLGAGMAMDPTDAAGLSAMSLPIGVYQVCETDAPASIVDRAAPFIVTVPMPNDGEWVYDVHAYPKNGEAAIEKSIDEQVNTGLGSVVTFPVSVVVPQSEKSWTGFAIRDTLDSRLTPVAAAGIAVSRSGVAMNANHYTVEVDGQQITVNLTAAGLLWLNEGPNDHVGAIIEVVFAGTVTSVGSGTIKNEAEFWPNNPDFDGSTEPIPSNEVETNWGSLAVQKVGQGSGNTPGDPLNGAIFEVYNAVEPYAADCAAAVADGSTPVTVGGETEFTSAGTGVISIPGLFVSDSVNPVVDATQRCYVLKEVQAPAGYVTPAGDDALTGVTVKIGETTVSQNVDIVNTQQEVPELPLTGAAGQVLMIAGGAAALAVVVGLVLMNRRREQAQL